MKNFLKLNTTLVIASLFIGCGSSHDVAINSKNIRSVSTTQEVQNDGISYLNDLRGSLGMIPLFQEAHLENAASNHARYLTENNIFSHYESATASYFSGVTPALRAVNAGYQHQNVGENISSGNVDVKDSIDTLFSAIYHRFGFLDFRYDEVGIGFSQNDVYAYGNVYNYNMGISPLRVLCEGEGVVRAGSYYENVCVDSRKQISVASYENALAKNVLQNPSLIVWPRDGALDISPVFYEESPDPLPECSVSGYPISISFNPLKSGTIMIDSFKLYDGNNQEIKDVKLMDKGSDHNGHFSDKEFALFPMKRLAWDSDYHVEIDYHDRDVVKREVVDFHTKALPYPSHTVQSVGVVIEVPANETHVFYLPPRDCNDKLTTFSASGVGSSLSFYDANTIMITASSKGTLKVSPSDGRDFTLIVR